METAMQELIRWASTELKLEGYEHKVIINKAKELLKKEKSQHEQTFIEGIHTLSVYRSGRKRKESNIFNNYYNNIFKQP